MIEKKLKQKGWNVSEIKQYQKHKKKHAPDAHTIIFRRLIEGIIVLLSLCVVLVFSISLIPIFIIYDLAGLLPVLAITGVISGLIFDFFVWELEEVKKRHHLFFLIILPIICFVWFFVMVSITNKYAVMFNNTISPVIVALTYVGSFIIPYVIGLMVQKKKYGI